MTDATTVSPEVDVYLSAVRAALADLPAEERDDLLVEVEASLADAAAESDAPVAARLGPPDEFAAELRTAAGLHPGPAAASTKREGFLVSVRRLARHPFVGRARALAHDLAPIWWVARGYAAVGIVAVWLGSEWSGRYPFVPRFSDGPVLGVALVGLGAVASVAGGLILRRRRAPFRLAALANLGLAAALIAVLVEVDNATLSRPTVAPEVGFSLEGLVYEGNKVTNVYPFDRKGHLLHDVFLYDQSGVALDIPGDPTSDPQRRFLTAKDGDTLFNAFPIRYFQPGTHKVANPDAGPRVDVPAVATPPLRAERR